MNRFGLKLKVFYFLPLLSVIAILGPFNLVIASTIDNQIIDTVKTNGSITNTEQTLVNPSSIVLSENNTSRIKEFETPDKSSNGKALDFNLSHQKTMNVNRSKENISSELDDSLLEILGITIKKPSFLGYYNDVFHLETNNLWINLNNSMCYHITKVLSALASGICEDKTARNLVRKYDSQLAFMLSFLKRR